MSDVKRHKVLVRDFSLVFVIAAVCSGFLAFLDAFDWFYIHTRDNEAYEFDDIVAFMTLFLVIGILVLALRWNKEATREISRRREAEEALNKLNMGLEERVRQRTAQYRQELDDRKRAEQRIIENQKQLRSLSAELSLVEERERRRIAINLHDNIGHTLAIIHNQFGILQNSISTDENRKLLGDIQNAVKELIRYSRSLISEIGSPLLDNMSFVSAVEWLAEQILGTKGILFGLNVEGEPDLPADDTRMLFLKTIREVLMNAMKHAEARNVTISVRARADDILVEIKDDGHGFDEPALSEILNIGPPGLGLSAIRERMIHLNGTCWIESRRGEGTRITLTLPYKSTVVSRTNECANSPG